MHNGKNFANVCRTLRNQREKSLQDARILSKVSGPLLPPTVLHREPLVSKLHAIIGPASSSVERRTSHYKLVLLCAPAGYGKTIALADYVNSTQVPCCWYFLEPADSDRVSFLTYLLASIRLRFPQFGAGLDELLQGAISANSSHSSDNWQYFEPILDTLVATINIEITERFVLLLCHYHEINASESVNHLVNRFLQKLPPHCILIIESRALPALEIAGLLAHRAMVGLGSENFYLNSQQIQQLAHLQQLPIPSDAEAEQLAYLFDGWIMGILLGTRLGGNVQLFPLYQNLPKEGRHSLWDLMGMHVDQQHLLLYLVDEVFKYEPEAYAFLKEAAVLEQITPDMCNTLLDTTDAEEQLQYLERQGLFVTHSGSAPQITYKCHPILRKLLCSELRNQNPQRFALLQQRAATLLRNAHDEEQAIYHALQAGQELLAAEIIIEVYQYMVTQGRIEILIRWMDALSASTLSQQPRLLLMRARLYTLCGEFIHALPLLENAAAKLLEQTPEQGVGEDNLLQAEVDLALSRVLFRKGKYNQAQKLCIHVLELLPLDEAILRAEAHNLLGITSNVVGQFTSGIAQFQKALQLWGRNTVNRETAELHSILASSYGIIGNFSLAEHHLSRSITCWNCLHDEWGKVYNLIRMGMIRYRQGILANAEILFNEALTIARGPIHFLRGEAYALNSLGEIYQEQELYEKSLKYLEDSLSLARQINDSFIMNTSISDLAMTYLLMGDSDTATLILSETAPQTAIKDGTGYDKVLCKLTLGMILLYQHSYQLAYTTLAEAATALHSIGLKRELLQARLRITSCLIAQGKRDEAIHLLTELTSATTLDCYEQTVLLELKRLPNLYSLVMKRPECSSLRAVLNPDLKEQTQQEMETQAPIISLPPSSPVAASSKSQGEMVTETVADQPQLKVLALGEPAVYRNDTPITRWRMARAMELYFFLLEANHPMRKEQIISSLWSDVDEPLDQTFRSTIFYLRKTLGETYLQHQAGVYILNTDATWYDVSIFCQHYKQAKEALQIKDDEVARTELLKMVDLYHGDYVQSFYSNWCTFRRDELKQLYLEGRRQLAHIHWRLEQFDESTLHWQHMLSLDNCLEDAHYGLMRCFLKQGKRGLALRQYQRCTINLRDELGVSPGATIQNLYQRLTETSTTRS